MKFSELSEEYQNELTEERPHLHEHNINGPYEVLLYNAEGTRFFYAKRKVMGANLYGSAGSCWYIMYGVTTFTYDRILGGIYNPAWTFGRGKCFGKSMNGTVIPHKVGTKKEVIAIAKAIGIFKI